MGKAEVGKGNCRRGLGEIRVVAYPKVENGFLKIKYGKNKISRDEVSTDFFYGKILKKLHSTIDLKLALGSMMGNVKRKNEKGSVRNDVY